MTLIIRLLSPRVPVAGVGVVSTGVVVGAFPSAVGGVVFLGESK